jgi:hypothetical protein
MSKKIATENLFIIRTGKRVDVFQGTGWDQWSQFSVVKGHPKLEKGGPLSEEDFKALKEVCNG